MKSLEQIKAEALCLSAPERTRLLEVLLASLEKDDEILAAWVEEAERRADAFDRGEMEAIDVEDAVARLRDKPADAASS